MKFLAPTTKPLGSQTPSYTSLNLMVLIGIKTSPKRNLTRADYILILKVINSFLRTFR